MTRAEAWVRFASAALSSPDNLGIADAANTADALLNLWAERFEKPPVYLCSQCSKPAEGFSIANVIAGDEPLCAEHKTPTVPSLGAQAVIGTTPELPEALQLLRAVVSTDRDDSDYVDAINQAEAFLERFGR